VGLLALYSINMTAKNTRAALEVLSHALVCSFLTYIYPILPYSPANLPPP
jgi:hypothetical protein